MQEFKTTGKTNLLDAVVNQMGFSSMNKGRKLIKGRQVMVDGKLVTIPTTPLSSGSTIRVLDEPQGMNQAASSRHLPFHVIYEDESLLAIEKPAGWISASPDRRKRTAFTVVKNWLLANDKNIEEVYFVNKLPKEASGLMIIAKDAITRVRLQEGWNRFEKRFYVLTKGQFHEDGEIGRRSKHKKDEEGFIFPYRNMMQGDRFAILRVEMEKEAFSELFSTLEAMDTPVPGYARRGKANDPLGRLGLHFFSIKLPIGKEDVVIKTRMPKEFLNLVKFNHA